MSGQVGTEAEAETKAGPEEWCDSGLGSLGEGQLPLPGAPGPDSAGERERERLDSALGDEEEAEAAAAEDVSAVGALAQGVGSVRLRDPPPPVAPEAWLRHVLGFLTEDGDTALHLAVIHEHEPFLDSILQFARGTAYLDLQNDLGQTALHIAAILGTAGFVRKLTAAGAGLGLQEKGGRTALHLACREGWRDCARHLLIPPGARLYLDCANYDGFTPLHVAVLQKDVEMVKLLLSAGANLDKAEPSCGRSPLHLAVEAQCPEVVECLLRAGADPGARMYVGYTPLYSALHRPNRRIPQLLRDFGSQEPDWDSEPESPDDASDDEYDDIIINSGYYKN